MNPPTSYHVNHGEIVYGRDFALNLRLNGSLQLYDTKKIFTYSVTNKHITVVQVMLPENEALHCTGFNLSKEPMHIALSYMDEDGNIEEPEYRQEASLTMIKGFKKLEPLRILRNQSGHFEPILDGRGDIHTHPIQKSAGEKPDGWKFQIQVKDRIDYEVHVLCNVESKSKSGIVYRK